MNYLKTMSLNVVFTVPMLLSIASVAEAKIRCHEGYQTNSIGTFATPYCEDNYLGQIARKYGMRVSNRAIRNNPNKKQAVCRFIGHDSRVREICRGFRSVPFGGYR